MSMLSLVCGDGFREIAQNSFFYFTDSSIPEPDRKSEMPRKDRRLAAENRRLKPAQPGQIKQLSGGPEK
ncbi:MAG: hypothetical protein ABGW82_14160 [Paracoccus sp. (in: a-proteobacteria)]|jgi:hypothetical protein|nr:hypothetical protein [Paracoccus sp. (in: a-proteobacteria)]MCS5602688.1 hypothetical protein [Paracoccus sp. (in: a-proteobacteria)]HIC67806.1 hypothetical protein [Paracoccus sp. (in: a-proteobacteria)]